MHQWAKTPKAGALLGARSYEAETRLDYAPLILLKAAGPKQFLGGGEVPTDCPPSLPRGFSRFPLNRCFLEPGDTSKHSARVLRSILPSSIRQKVGFRAQNGPGSFFCLSVNMASIFGPLTRPPPQGPENQASWTPPRHHSAED